MENERLDLLLDAALEAAAAGSAVLLHHLSHQNDRLVIRAKRDGSPVSAVDLESHTAIQNVLAPHGIPIISEEGDLPPYAEHSNWRSFGSWTHWMAPSRPRPPGRLCHQHCPMRCIRTILGVVADPLSERIFAGTQTRAPFTVSLTNLSEHQPITPRPATRPYRLVTSWNEALSKEDLLPASLDAGAFLMEAVSGALKFCLLATGEADVHARSASYMEWDCAAGDGILRSMGIAVRDRETNQPLTYNSEPARGESYASRL